MELKIPINPFRTHGGVHAPHRKNTAKSESVMMPVPDEVVIPMSMHIGAPCKAIVKAKDEVKVGQKIGETTGFMSAPIHASVSGIVKSVGKVPVGSGGTVDAVVITSDGEMTVSEDVKPPVINSKEDFLNAIKESGLVGLGGAGFPTHVKLAAKEPIDTLLINGAECEPYITADTREALEDSDNIIDGIFAVMKYVDIPRCIICIENNKMDAINHLKEKLRNDPRNSSGSVGVLALRALYPQGAEKTMIKAATDRVVPMGKLPSSVGVIVMNISSVGFVGNYLKTGMPLVSKRVTVDGSAVAEPKNVIVPVGTSFADIIAFCGGYKEEPRKIISGGPMMGMTVSSDDTPLTKSGNAVLAFGEKDKGFKTTTDCINCGFCLTVCPMNLMPTTLEKLTEFKMLDELRAKAVMNCIECGCCSYNCPAGRPLVQAIRIGKGLVRADDAAQRAKAEAEKAKQAAQQ